MGLMDFGIEMGIKKFYIYAHINPLKNEIFYIGKGTGDRAYRKNHRSKWWKSTIDKYGYIIDIIESDLTEEKAFEREKFYIKRIGRRDLGTGTLINMSDGGTGGSSGRVWSEETKKKMSDSQKKIAKFGEENNFFGKHHSEETREKMREAKKDYIPWIKGKSRFKNEEEKKEAHRLNVKKYREKLKKQNLNKNLI